jgi:hypothetical protein
LDGLHDGSKVEEINTKITGEDGTEIDTSVYLEVDNKRQFTPRNGFDTIIGYEGDVNSQVILFKLPNTYDSHQLSKCKYKLVRWKNLISGAEGISDLINIPETDYYYWEVDSELYTRAGSIEISLSFEDKDKNDEKIMYSWNTSLYTGLSVGKTITSVGSDLPAKDEILIVDRETRKIVAPQGYNNNVCNRGEVGMGKLYFLINDILGSDKTIDGSDIKFYITVNGKVHSRYTTANGLSGFKTTTVENIDYPYNKNNDKMILLGWVLPEEVTMNVEGTFGVSIEIEKNNGEKPLWRWVSSPYTNLTIGKSDLTAEDTPITPTPQPGGGGEVVPGLTEAQVIALI